MPLPRQTAFYTAYTFNNSAYIGSGDPLVDTNQGIVAGTDVTGVPARLWVVSLDRSGPLGMGLSAKYTSSRRVSLRSDWYADAYWLVDAYVSFSGEALSDLLRSTEFSIVANNLLDKTLSVGHHRERGVARGAADGLDDRDRLVLMAATAPVPKPLPTASTSPRRETRA